MSEYTQNTKEDAVTNAVSIDLTQCYECAKKHVGRAQQFFEEYHTGYDDRTKRLIQSLKVSEEQIRKAFLLYCRIQSQLDMGAGELLGNSRTGVFMEDSHVAVACAIREERLKFQDNPLYVPDFDSLLVKIQLLQYSE